MQKLEKSARAWAVTAWRLRDGEVVYRRADGGWAEGFGDGEVLHDKPAADAALARAQDDERARIVVGAYLFEVAEDGGYAVPASVREKIRAKGPTVRVDVGKQAAHA
jgi:Protein of unknown function (DUF2849)